MNVPGSVTSLQRHLGDPKHRIAFIGKDRAELQWTDAGMVFSFVVNGLFTFRTERLTLRQALLFVGTTGTVMWVAQPLLIHGWLWALDGVDRVQPGAQLRRLPLGGVADHSHSSRSPHPRRSRVVVGPACGFVLAFTNS